MTASTYAYSKFYTSGFRILPYASQKQRQYAIIFASGLLGYRFGKIMVSSITGDSD
jgi:hypothetical protein